MSNGNSSGRKVKEGINPPKVTPPNPPPKPATNIPPNKDTAKG